jgi:hypothetical protein
MRLQATTGETVDILPQSFKPLSYVELAADGIKNSKTYKLEGVAESVEITGRDKQTEQSRFSITINFRRPVSIYALVEGGWLPPPFVTPPNLFVDRNVVQYLGQIARGSKRPDLIDTDWWLSLVKDSSLLINPALYALEGSKRRTPSFEEFCTSFEEASQKIANQLPDAKLVTYEAIHYKAAYEILTDLDERHKRESEFLVRVAPLIAFSVADSKLRQVESFILCTADDLRLERKSLVVIAVLSCLYQRRDGSGFLTARRIIKPLPNGTYTPQHAHNALADLRSLELFIGSLGFRHDPFALCTCDKAIALFWCGLAPDGFEWKGDNFSFNVTLSEHLFPRLQESDGKELAERLFG